MAETKEKKSMYVFHLVMMVIIAFGFRFLPCPGPVTPYGMAVLGVFISLIYGWTFLDLLVPTLFGALVLSTTEYGSAQTVFTNMFTNQTVLLMLFGTLAFAVVQQTGAGDYLIAKLLSSKLAKKSPIFVMEIFFVIFILGLLFGLVWFLYFALIPLMENMLLKCGYKKGDKFNALFLCGCLMAGQLGMCIFPFFAWSLMTSGTMTALTQVPVNTGEFIALMLLLIAVFMITYPFFMKLCGCSFDKLATVDVEEVFGSAIQSDTGKMSRAQLLSIVSVVAFIVLVVLLSILATSVPALEWLNNTWGMTGLMVALWLFIVVYKVDGKPLLDMKAAAGGFSWDMLLLIGFALLISSALTADSTGISAWISSLLMPIFSQTSPIVFLLALAVFTTVITNVSNNIAICFIMLNIVASLYNNGLEINIMAALLIVTLTPVMVAYLTPAASMPGALMHASPANTPATLYKWVPLMMIYSFFVLFVVLIPYVLIMG